MSENIILTGFMGTGKTTAGKILARELNRPFVDMDLCISESLSKPVDKIFLEEGEMAFRKYESELCNRLSQQENLVIATGGGTVVDPANMLMLKSSGRLICLKADVDTILERVQKVDCSSRPLLQTSDKRAGIIRLLSDRETSYLSIPWHVDTSGLGPEQVVDKVSIIARAENLHIRSPMGAYPVWIGNGLLFYCGDALYQTGVPTSSKVAIVSAPKISEYYTSKIMKSLQKRGYQPVLCLVEEGETNKNLETIAYLYDQFISAGLERGDTVLALGGGVIGDMAGFASATFIRGVRFAQIPTTLLAMVDASIGGKTGVNLLQGKNLVGAFKQPCMVLMDPDVLQSLPEPELRSGLAEIIKHGLISDDGLFELLENLAGDVNVLWSRNIGLSIIAKAVQVKKRIVEADPFEKGFRVYLNLGHTTGHALEKISNFNLRHGEAVSIGMLAAARVAVKLGVSETALLARIAAVLKRWKLPVTCPPYLAGEIYQVMKHDKKKQGGELRWILPEKIGKVSIHKDIPADIVVSVLKEMGAI